MKTFKIGNVKLDSCALLAPMAGVSDRAYRELCSEFGAGYCVSEMVSSKALSFNSKKSEELMEISELERPCGIQIFGGEPECMARAAESAMRNAPDVIDINMGCPAPKISSSGSGSALMKDPRLCGRIVQAVVASCDVPVTVKIRKGWDDNSINAVEVAKILEAAGASAIAVHGRTRSQYYAGRADWEMIRRVREAVTIPVIGNGDVTSPASARAMLDETGVDGIRIARAAEGNPWIFSAVTGYLSTGEIPPGPTGQEIYDTIMRQMDMMIRLKGERTGIREMRKHISWYTTGFPNSAALRRQINATEDPEEITGLLRRTLLATSSI